MSQLGYEVYEDTRTFEQKGLTGEVKRYATDKMKFPCYIIESTAENSVALYRVKVLRQMFATTKVYDDDANNLIHLYFSQDNTTVKLGIIQPKQVKAFLKLFDGNVIVGFLDKDTILHDEHLYVLAE